ncbi:MAG TPA: nuclear transport factor 2 family protein [Candidatus Eisenbacteria bacterium]|nr:nuclear transport factor 2 family protein [Candidatus Eisenbacteria bacterium]
MNTPVWRIALCAAILVIAMAGFAAIRPTPNSEKPGIQASIQALLAAQQSAWNSGDIPGFMARYWNSPELTFASSKGFTRGWESVLQRYQKTYVDKAAMGKLDFSELEIRELGSDAALVLGHWNLQRQSGDIGGIFTLVLRKFPEGWRIIHDHTTQNMPEGATPK